MAEILMFHHALGLTDGVREFADRLRSAGHTVHSPDLYEGHVFRTVDEGVAHARKVGFGTIMERGRAAAGALPNALVYVGMSLGVMPAQMLAQTRAGAKGALLLYACLPADEFGAWPAGVPVQIHAMDADPSFVDEGDIDAARALIAATPEARMFLYPGDRHLFADSSLADYDAQAAALLVERVLAFLAGIC